MSVKYAICTVVTSACACYLYIWCKICNILDNYAAYLACGSYDQDMPGICLFSIHTLSLTAAYHITSNISARVFNAAISCKIHCLPC